MKHFGFQVCRNVLIENYTQNHFSVWDIQVHTEGSKKEIKPTWKFILEQWYNNRPKMTACLNPQFATINRIVSEQSTSWPSKLALVSQGPKAILLVIRDSQVLAKLVVVTIFFIGWGQTARLQRVRQNTADRIQTETEQQQTARLQRVRQNTADRILKFDKRYKAFEIAGYFEKHREIIG